MKKKKVIDLIICDFCGKEADGQCELCGRDVCRACARWICKKKYAPVSGGPYLRSFGNSYAPYPWEWDPEKQLCKDCVEKFKMAITMLAGKKIES